MHTFGRAVVAAGIAVSVAMTAACGSDSDSGAPAEPVIDLASLDVGNLPTELKPYDKPTSIEQAKLVEAWRLGNALPLPVEIMPEVKYAPSAMGGAIRSFIDFSSTVMKSRASAEPDAMTAAAPGFVTGFLTTGRSDSVPSLSYELDNVVMIFADEQSATNAAAALERINFEAEPGSEEVRLAKYPAALSYATDNISGPGQLRSWYATGKFVIFSYVYDSVMSALKERDLGKLTERAERSFETISARLATFQPTPQDNLMDLAPDPDGMLARALPTVADDQSQRGVPGVYDRQGGLQVSLAPDEDTTLFQETGVDAVAWRGNFVYRAQDAAGAAEIVTVRSATSRKFRPVESPANLPNALCREYYGSKYDISFYCFVSHGRYAAEVAANQLLDAQQRISAQYARLVNAG
ncbi:DUF7373 family lipoprotein [Nocardia crassostreae]|uniref:DUF7373 family lipoprotein n=1 Tax=Nocardia crassostreae TaxID=53428 RepID=UPI0008372649|nr:hypothetical protein [Nocardia crassostreae]